MASCLLLALVVGAALAAPIYADEVAKTTPSDNHLSEQITVATERYGLDDPLPTQYVKPTEGIFNDEVECFYGCGSLRTAFLEALPVTFCGATSSATGSSRRSTSGGSTSRTRSAVSCSTSRSSSGSRASAS